LLDSQVVTASDMITESHIRTVASSLPPADSRLPSGSGHIHRTMSVWATKMS
jgi:hypothetical protein